MATTVAYPGVGGHVALTSTAGALLTVLDAVLVTGQGWTKPFSSGNVAVYKQPAGSNGFYLRVDDSGANFARACLYETMSDVNTGTGRTPTSVQLNGGYYIHKKTPGGWIAFAHGGNLHLFTQYDSIRTYYFRVTDLISNKPADAYQTNISGQIADNATTSNTACVSSFSDAANFSHVVRSASGTGESVDAGQINASLGSVISGSGPAYPDPVSGKLRVGKFRIAEKASGSVRGYMPGVLLMGHNGAPFTDRSTLDGTGALAGRTFMAVSWGLSGAQQILIETSDNWGPF